MDIRGIEVTNQLRSAIRAKLLELGVRYDEELPDYILIMVVNKKSRQQMHEDLNLFLENNTTPFVDWLHDQVLRKLQKVTIVKKKSTTAFVPTVIVKQEEERKKQWSIRHVEDRNKEQLTDQNLSVKSVEDCMEDNSVSRNTTNQIEHFPSTSPLDLPPSTSPQHVGKSVISIDYPSSLSNQSVKRIELVSSHYKRLSGPENSSDRSEKQLKISDFSTRQLKQRGDTVHEERRLKSCVNKPTITSIVSVKTRLGVSLPRNHLQFHKEKYTRSKERVYGRVNRRDSVRGKQFEIEIETDKGESNNRAGSMNIKNRMLGRQATIEKPLFTRKLSVQSATSSVKNRLGAVAKSKFKIEDSQDGAQNFRNRIGMATSKFRALGRMGVPRTKRDGDLFDNDSEPGDEDNISVPVKSRIIAVKRSTIDKGDRWNSKTIKQLKDKREKEEGNDEGKVLASKVIVTPRPLQPLPPVQKRATQSLLLRAVAEANQSVVQQKNPEPCSKDEKPILKRLRASDASEIARNLSVHFNASKRMVMEKIQVELTNSDTRHSEDPEPYVPRSVTEEHMGVVMSLFQRGDDDQKFLVTLNGYNNNRRKEKTSPGDDERLEMEASEEDRFSLCNMPNNSLPENVETFESDEMDTSEQNEQSELGENHLRDTLATKDSMKKPRKLSPITYNRSPNSENINHSEAPTGLSKISAASIMIGDTAREQCRYWPNCTLGNECAYLHPALSCSAFPTCHFGLSCRKLSCAFLHPSQQCKYHPYCTKQDCAFSHSSGQPIIPADVARAKFTWRRKD